MTIYGVFLYFRAILEVIVSYCLAFLGLAVMISLAPFFITLILFERTKSMFDNWISIMFNYMMQPTILLIFFLLIEQIMGAQLSKIVVKACWGTLIPLVISLDLNNLGIPINFSFSLPFLPGIPFYIPQLADSNTIDSFYNSSGTFAVVATSSFLFFALCKLSNGLVDYVTLIAQYLTNVLAARKYGKLQTGLNPIKDITNDMDKIISPTRALGKVKNFAKAKIIDQKVKRRG
ncbi:type IV secretion system protein [Rickettsiaceae bacterium]|nr:type IV secretion system protein [Rickettsiaceae bacterium]